MKKKVRFQYWQYDQKTISIFGSNFQLWKSTSFPSHHITSWPSFLSICFFSLSPFLPIPVRQTWAFNLLLYEDLSVVRGWCLCRNQKKPSWKESENFSDRSGKSPSYLATRVSSPFCPAKNWETNWWSSQRRSISAVTAGVSFWRCLEKFLSHHCNLAKSRLAKKTSF